MRNAIVSQYSGDAWSLQIPPPTMHLHAKVLTDLVGWLFCFVMTGSCGLCLPRCIHPFIAPDKKKSFLQFNNEKNAQKGKQNINKHK